MNTLRTALFMTVLTLLLVIAGRALGGQSGMVIALVMATVMNFGAAVVPGWALLAMGGLVLSRDVRVFAAAEHWITNQSPKAERALGRSRKRFSLLRE